jgi:HEPN domain-containing protein
MTRQRFPPDDPREWLSRARTNLHIARMSAPEVHLEELCFNAQQAAEKAIKAVFVSQRASFPFTHDLYALVGRLEKSGVKVPGFISEAAELTRYAFEVRYPSVAPEVTEEEYRWAVTTAEAVVRWAEQAIAASG